MGIRKTLGKAADFLYEHRPFAAPKGVSLVSLVAYDWPYLFKNLLAAYPYADEIILGLDADRISWSQKRYEFDEAAFRAALQDFDRENKIRVIEGNFHASKVPMENDTHERNVLSRHCRPGNWVLQLDADERLLNPQAAFRWLRGCRKRRCLQARWLTVFKIIDDKALVTDAEWTPVATLRRESYVLSRKTAEPKHKSPLLLLHFGWGRTKPELLQKVTHWSHSQDFDAPAFLSLWESVTLDNYREFRNFHPVDGPVWPSLEMVDLGALDDRYRQPE